jgi:long-chain fatty acid transport protein
MKQTRPFLILGAAIALFALTTSPALCSGFSIYEQSAKASAQAGAFAARADDAAANWYNPAALTKQGASFQFGVNAITIGDATTLTLDQFLPGTEPGTVTTPGTEIDAESNLATPIHLYYARPAGKRLAWGIGINNPFGLLSEWPFPVSISAKKSELHTWVLNGNVAYALTDAWSIAVGVDYLYADIKNFARDFNQQELNDLLPSEYATQNLSGDGDDWGWNAALHYGSERWAFGLAYRSSFSPEIDGQLEFSDFDDFSDLVKPALQTTPGKTTLNLPDQAAAGLAYKGSRFEVELDVSWAKWSKFDVLDIQIDSMVFPDQVIPELWDDTTAIRLGGAYDIVKDKHQIRAGILTDENPVPDATLRPSIPDSDRDSFTVGYGWSGRSIDLDFYYMALFFDERTVAANPLDPSVIAGTYESFSHLAGVTFSWRFGD